MTRAVDSAGPVFRRWHGPWMGWILCSGLLLWACSNERGRGPTGPTGTTSSTGSTGSTGSTVASPVGSAPGQGTLSAVQGGASPSLHVGKSTAAETAVTTARPVRPSATLWPRDDGQPLPAAAGYVGSQVCATCHPQKHRAWSHDWHAKALSPVQLGSDGKAEAVVGPFDDAHFAGDSSEAWMHRSKSGYFMTTRDEAGALRDLPVAYVIGGKRMQDSVAILPDGRWQILPVYFHVTSGAWVDYNEAKQGRVGPKHPFFWTRFRRNANHECLDCHSTGLNVRFDRDTLRFQTGMADAGVGCESCHGPGAAHSESRAAADIVHPGRLHRSKAGKQRAFHLCAQCHGPRQPVFPVLDANRHFRSGQDYEALYQPLVLTNGQERSGEFFVDGRPRSSSFEYQALVQSRCYMRGGATCLDCHSAPHATHGANELPLRPRPNDAGCLRCHPALAGDSARARHSHHRSEQAQSCVACHMPKVVTGVLDAFADHAIDVPVPQNEDRHGIRSACRLCHADQSPASLSASLLRLWPGAGKRQARRLRLADAIDEKGAKESESALRAVLADRSEAPTLRSACALLLAGRFPNAGDALVPLLSDASPLVRARAAEAIGSLRQRSFDDRLTALLTDPSLMVRQSAALSLAKHGDLRAEAPLRKMARDPHESGLLYPHFVLGLLAMRQGDVTAAITRFEQAADRVPYYIDALLALSDIYTRTGQIDKARARLQQALFFEPQNKLAQDGLRRLPAK